MKTPALAAAIGCMLAASIPAASQADSTKVAVSYADLNLNSVQGRKVLKDRIEAAAREVCGMKQAQTTGSRLPSRSALACYDKATGQIGDSIARAIERRNADG